MDDTKRDEEQIRDQAQDSEPNGEGGKAPESEETELEKVTRELEEWRTKADEYLDKYRRSLAELANYRKRVEREREGDDLRLRRRVMGSILPILDDFALAIDNIPDEHDNAGWVEGITLIERKLAKLLESYGVVPIDAVGKPFDPYYHEAFTKRESDEYPEGTVIEELRKGYMLDDTVLRPTLVAVSAGPRGEQAAGEDAVSNQGGANAGTTMEQ